MKLNEIKFEGTMRVRLPEWYKDDFLRIKKSGRNSNYLIAQRWYARKMELDENYIIPLDELLSENWIKID